VIHYLDLVDYLLIAEAVTGIPAETPAKLPGIDLAGSALHAPQAEFGSTEFYPDFPSRPRSCVRDCCVTIRCWTGTSARPGLHSKSSWTATATPGQLRR